MKTKIINWVKETSLQTKTSGSEVLVTAATSLKLSIKKWNAIIDGSGIDLGAKNCQLCIDNLQSGYYCKRCIIYAATGEDVCNSIGYRAWTQVAACIAVKEDNDSDDNFIGSCTGLGVFEYDRANYTPNSRQDQNSFAAALLVRDNLIKIKRVVLEIIFAASVKERANMSAGNYTLDK